MIQRIQSVYLLLATLLLVSMNFLQLANYNTYESEFVFKTKGIFEQATGTVFYPTAPLLWLVLFTALLTIANIFMYNRRLLQIKIGGALVLLLSGIVALFFFFGEGAKETMESPVTTFKIPAFFPVLAILLVLLANRAIRKDERLVRSADRIR